MRRGALVGLLAVACVGVGASALVASPPGFHSSIQPVPTYLRTQMTGSTWHRGCPVSLSQLRVLRTTYWGFDGRVHTGAIVTNQRVAGPLRQVFRRLFELRFPIHSVIGGVLFYDGGNVYRTLDDYDILELRHVAGAGLRLQTPIGPFRVEYGAILNRKPGEDRGQFFFSIGQAF